VLDLFRGEAIEQNYSRMNDMATHRPEGSVGLLGSSPAIRAIRQRIPGLARVDWPLVITGEGGTGKGLLARTIHQARAGAGGYFEADIGAVLREYVGLEVFGLERGVISWAKESQPGLLELAHGGTVCLRNFDLWPPYLELALLRVLREGVIFRMGGGPPIPIRVRIIGITSSDPTTLVKIGALSRDLFRALAVDRVHLPPLRERRDDIPVLARHFVSRFAASFGDLDVGISEAALSRLCAYQWPGNIRELANVLELAFARRHSSPPREPRPIPPDPRPIGVADLPPYLAVPSSRPEA
jgi:DNA-binding NtrC family response regulator